jgi:hypothetical protein
MDDKYAIDCTKSMHLLKNEFTKKYLSEQCEQLLEGLDRAIAATVACAPVRRNSGYFVQRDGGTPSAESTEALWERALWAHFSDPRSSPAVPGAWYRLVTYQVPLRNTQDDDRWGYIDLLGVTHQGLPVVVELKRPGAHDVTPAEMLVQAAAYALALRKAWTEGFGRQWYDLVSAKYGFRAPPSSGASPVVHLVGAAPTEYWQNWIGNTPKARQVTAHAWPQVSALVTALGERGLPATFVEIRHEGLNSGNSPQNLSCRVIDPFVASTWAPDPNDDALRSLDSATASP